MQAVCHTDVGYKLIAVKVGLLMEKSEYAVTPLKLNEMPKIN